MKAKTFGELENAESVTFEELQNSLEDYVNSGGGICARVVKEIIDKMNLSIVEFDKLIALANKGVSVQSKRREFDAAREYINLLVDLQEKSFTLMGM